MREEYIKQVARALHVPRRVKKEVIRDLNEIFASASENGENEQQVIDRLGEAKQFAQGAAEQLGVDMFASGKQKQIFSGIAALAVAVLAFVLYGAARSAAVGPGTIGQADAMTNITISGGFGVDRSAVVFALGVVAAAVALFQIIRAAGQKRRSS